MGFDKKRYWKMRAKGRSHTYDSRMHILSGNTLWIKARGLVTGLFPPEAWQELKKMEKELIKEGLMPDPRRGRRRTLKEDSNEVDGSKTKIQG